MYSSSGRVRVPITLPVMCTRFAKLGPDLAQKGALANLERDFAPQAGVVGVGLDQHVQLIVRCRDARDLEREGSARAFGRQVAVDAYLAATGAAVANEPDVFEIGIRFTGIAELAHEMGGAAETEQPRVGPAAGHIDTPRRGCVRADWRAFPGAAQANPVRVHEMTYSSVALPLSSIGV